MLQEVNIESRLQSPDTLDSIRKKRKSNRKIAAGVACAAISVYFGTLIIQETIKQDLSREEANGGIGSGVAAATGAIYLLKPRR